MNIALYYEKEQNPEKFDSLTNLKWDEKRQHNSIHTRAFFEQVILMFRAKLLMENKNPARSKLIWFYPASMPAHRIDNIKTIWGELFAKYMGESSSPVAFSESIAPFYYYKKNKLTAYSRPVAAIDIGGETSDVVVYEENKPLLLTSFRFAAKSLFGFRRNNNDPKQNGIFLKYHEKMTDLVKKNASFLDSTLEEITKKNKSEDIISFWFSLENNSEVKGNEALSFSKILREDKDMKIVFAM